MTDLTLDKVIARLKELREIAGRDLPIRFADGYDNALSIMCVDIEEDTGWDGEPEGPFVVLS